MGGCSAQQKSKPPSLRARGVLHLNPQWGAKYGRLFGTSLYAKASGVPWRKPWGDKKRVEVVQHNKHVKREKERGERGSIIASAATGAASKTRKRAPRESLFFLLARETPSWRVPWAGGGRGFRQRAASGGPPSRGPSSRTCPSKAPGKPPREREPTQTRHASTTPTKSKTHTRRH